MESVACIDYSEIIRTAPIVLGMGEKLKVDVAMHLIDALVAAGRLAPELRNSAFADVHAREVLDGYLREHHTGRLGDKALLEFDGGLQSVGIVAVLDDASGELVDYEQFAVLDYVVLVYAQRVLRLKGVLDALERLHVVVVEKVLNAQQALEQDDALFGHADILGKAVDLEVDAVLHLLGELGALLGQRVVVLDVAGDDQRDTGLVDEH